MFHFAIEPIRLPSIIAVRELGFSISVFIFICFLVSFKMLSLSSYWLWVLDRNDPFILYNFVYHQSFYFIYLLTKTWFISFQCSTQVPISRSAVNHESGAKTGLSGIVTGIIMNCALLFLTPLFEYIPQAGMFPL